MKKKKKEFVRPSHFEIELVHENKDCLMPIVNWLLENGDVREIF